MSKTILGIDVGMYGALCFYDGEEFMIHDMPIFERNKTNRVDCHKLVEIIRLDKIDHAYIEQVNAFGMGASSAYNFGWSCGAIEAVLACMNVPFTYVTPMRWKKEMSVPANKDAARMRATQLMPEFSHNWSLKKHDGRAESALISLWGFNK